MLSARGLEMATSDRWLAYLDDKTVIEYSGLGLLCQAMLERGVRFVPPEARSTREKRKVMDEDDYLLARRRAGGIDTPGSGACEF